MNAATATALRGHRPDRRRRLEAAIAEVGAPSDFVRLLHEVASALSRMDTGTYGSCEVCHETVDDDFLESNPAIQYCLCRLSAEQQQALQNDLDLANRIQW